MVREQHDGDYKDIAGELEQRGVETEYIPDIIEVLEEKSYLGPNYGQGMGLEGLQDNVDVEDLDKEVSEAVDYLNQLYSEMSDIMALIDSIDDVASQANMLSLNASIEAARANGEGAGFGTVAEEFKSLAEDIDEAADDIDDEAGDMQKSIEEVAHSIYNVQNYVEQLERNI